MGFSDLASRLRAALSPGRTFARILYATFAGLAAAGVAFVALGAYLGNTNSRQSLPPESPEPAIARDSFSHRIAAGKVLVGVPSSGQEALLSELRPGDLLDVLTILPGGVAQGPTTVTVVRKATVLRQGARASSPLLLETSPDESLALAHLISRGARLTYALSSSRPAS